MLLAVIWAIALAGFVSKVFLAHRVHLVSVAPYVFLGWLPVVAAPALVHAMPMNIFWWMLVGGLFYTVGTLFLIYDARVRHFHAVWHLCVIAGSACHFCGILFSVASNRA
jgi:hemolysin III